jgi:hypothetical protein
VNIFILDHDPVLCAQYHVDRHAVKMIVEYGQLLSTAHRILDGIPCKRRRGTRLKSWYSLENPNLDLRLYSHTHVNHPCALWARQSSENYLYLYRLLVELCKEYTYRYGRVHKLEASGLLRVLQILPVNIPISGITKFAQAMPEQYKSRSTVKAYRSYYNGEKQHLFKWKHRDIPHWIE